MSKAVVSALRTSEQLSIPLHKLPYLSRKKREQRCYSSFGNLQRVYRFGIKGRKSCTNPKHLWKKNHWPLPDSPGLAWVFTVFRGETQRFWKFSWTTDQSRSQLPLVRRFVGQNLKVLWETWAVQVWNLQTFGSRFSRRLRYHSYIT